MKQTDQEADEAVAFIRQNTADPIRRFLDSVAHSRLEEASCIQDMRTPQPGKPNCLRAIQEIWARSKQHLFTRDR
jgi:hypothetical protein